MSSHSIVSVQSFLFGAGIKPMAEQKLDSPPQQQQQAERKVGNWADMTCFAKFSFVRYRKIKMEDQVAAHAIGPNVALPAILEEENGDGNEAQESQRQQELCSISTSSTSIGTMPSNGQEQG